MIETEIDGISCTFQELKDRPINYVSLVISLESGCNPQDGEYSLHLGSTSGALDLNSVGGVDDITLIKECIEEYILSTEFPDEGYVDVMLKESGEWEGWNWQKYYELERACIVII